MDTLIGAFSATQVSLQPNSIAAEHPHFSLYKAKKFTSQEERRQKFLANQKSNRYDFASHARNLATNEWQDEEEEEECEENEEENEDMEWETAPKKPPRSYKNQIMLSEWLVEVPGDFEQEWFLMPCPVGKRCLVVSARGFTKAYNRGGYLLNSFPSYLPGGNRSNAHHKSATGLGSYCLLDCVYSDIEKTYYVLDIMCWNCHPYFDCETSFRFYWLSEKISEIPEVKETSKINPYKFIPLNFYSCDPNTIKGVLWSPMPFSAKLDGLLFYHKQTHYTCGATPLVGWLKAFMVPEILNIEVPEIFNSEKPASYITMQQHIPKAFEKVEKRKKKEEKVMQCDDT